MTLSAVLEKLCGQILWCRPVLLEATLELALEIAREGREGRRIGTLFTVGKADAVLAASRPLILDPLVGPAPERTHHGSRSARHDQGTGSARWTVADRVSMTSTNFTTLWKSSPLAYVKNV